MKRKIGIGVTLTAVLLWAAGLLYAATQNISSYTGTMTAGSGGAFSVGTDGSVSAPQFTSTATDGQHYVLPYNTGAFGGSPSEGMLVTNSSGQLLQYHGSAWGAKALVVATGTSGLGTSAISSGACATAVTTGATGVLTTDVIDWGFNGDPTAVTGYVASTSGMLTIIAYPTAGNVSFKACNNTAASITPGAITLNWKVTR